MALLQSKLSDDTVVFPTTPEAILAYGPARWHENYKEPISGAAYQELIESLFTEFRTQLEKVHNDAARYHFLLGSIKAVVFLAHHSFSIARYEELRARGFEKILNSQELDIEIALADPSPFLRWKSRTPESWKSLLAGALMRMQSIATVIAHCIKTRTLNSLSYFTLARHQTPLFAKFLTQSNISPRCISLPRITTSEALSNDWSLWISSVGESLVSTVLTRHPKLKSQKQLLQLRLFEYLSSAAKEYLAYLKQLPNTSGKTLLSTILGAPTFRMYQAAWRARGGKVIGFSHGNQVCVANPLYSYVDGTIVDEYIVNEPGTAVVFDYFFKHWSFGNTPVLVRAIAAEGIEPPNPQHNENAVRKVMVIGFPMTQGWYPWFVEQHALANLWLEYSVLKSLKQAGFFVQYKAHPEGMDHLQHIYAELVDEFCTAPFEEVIHTTDCFIFCHSNTSTFGTAILTNKPVVYMDIEGRAWHPEARMAFAARCHFVPVTITAPGRATYDNELLIETVSQAGKNCTGDLLRRFSQAGVI